MTGLDAGVVIRRAASVYGVVQGVSFRWFTMQEANRLGLVGWVRNERDGSVRLEAQGPATDVEELVAWISHGPPLARVDHVEVETQSPTETDIDFRVVY